MIDLLTKTMFTGIGLLSLTKDKIEEVARDFVEKGKLSEQEGQKLVGELLKRSEESRAEFNRQIEEGVRKFMDKADLASKNDVKKLQEEIAELRLQLKTEKE